MALLLITLPLGATVQSASAGCACGGGNWDPIAFLNYDTVTPGTVAIGGTGGGTSAQVQPRQEYRSDRFANGDILKPLMDVSSTDVVIDVSDQKCYDEGHVSGAISLPWQGFLGEDGSVKDTSELAAYLGEAGITRTESLVVYADDLKKAALAFWSLRYLGHQDVALMDGGLDDWTAAGLPTEREPTVRKGAEYIPEPKTDLLTSYEYVKGKDAQLIDLRSFQEFGRDRIDGSIYFDPEEVFEKGRIKDDDQLKDAFGGIGKGLPVVVYSDDYSTSALVWYALQLMGYDSRIYSWADWTAHQPQKAAKEESAVYRKLGRT